MALPEASVWAIVIGVVLVAAVVAFRPLLARLAARNIGRRKSRVLIVVAGLLVGTAIISSSLVVGDTLSYIFLEDVYARLDAIDELVSNTFNGQLFSFSESNFTQIATDLAASNSPIDGIAPALLKIMPVRNVAGNKGNQQITVMGLDATLEGGYVVVPVGGLVGGRREELCQRRPGGRGGRVQEAAGLVVGLEQRLDAPPQLGVGPALAVQQGRALGGGSLDGRQEYLLDPLRVARHGTALREQRAATYGNMVR